MREKVYLGKHKTEGETYLYKHEWVNWYWAFGYVGNSRNHWHIEAMIFSGKHVDNWNDIEHHFDKTWITQEQWWILRNLFITAYALKKAAEELPHLTTSEEMAKRINTDLNTILDNIWELVVKWEEQSRSKWANCVGGQCKIGVCHELS